MVGMNNFKREKSKILIELWWKPTTTQKLAYDKTHEDAEIFLAKVFLKRHLKYFWMKVTVIFFFTPYHIQALFQWCFCFCPSYISVICMHILSILLFKYSISSLLWFKQFILTSLSLKHIISRCIVRSFYLNFFMIHTFYFNLLFVIQLLLH